MTEEWQTVHAHALADAKTFPGPRQDSTHSCEVIVRKEVRQGSEKEGRHDSKTLGELVSLGEVYPGATNDSRDKSPLISVIRKKLFIAIIIGYR